MTNDSKVSVYPTFAILIQSREVPLLRRTLSRQFLPLFSEKPSMSMSFAHNDGVSSIKSRQQRHTCAVIRVVLGAPRSMNMLALAVNMSKRTSLLSMLIEEDKVVDIDAESMGMKR